MQRSLNVARQSIFKQSCKLSGTGSRMDVEEAKRKAAYAAVDKHVGKDQVVGVGSGSTIVYAVQRLQERNLSEQLNIRCVPTSYQAKQLILEAKLPLTELEQELEIDVTIDGCDEADETLTLIKGGGGCLTQEKIVAANSKLFVVIADYRKNSKRLGEQWKYIPIEVVPFAWKQVKNKIENEIGGGVAKLRMAKAKAGPVVTDNSCFLLDWYWTEGDHPRYSDPSIPDWARLNTALVSIPGVLETGLFPNMAKYAYFGTEAGEVQEVHVEENGTHRLTVNVG